MAIQLGDTAPDFTAETTEGTVSLHDYLGDGWGILFSHPADFTPVCTTELGAFANRKDEFSRRNTKLIGVSVDDVASHEAGRPTSPRPRAPRSTSRSWGTRTGPSRSSTG